MLRLVAMCGSALVLCLTSLSAPAQAATQYTDSKVMFFNYCGAVCQKGSTANPMTTTLDGFEPDVVLLNEVCTSQYANMLSIQQSPGHWKLYGMFTYVRNANGADECGSGGPLGNVILSHVPLTADGEAELTPDDPNTPANERRVQKVSCAKLSDTFSTEACVVHTAPTDDPAGIIRSQIATATNFAYSRAAGRPLLFAGDFNRTPSLAAMDQVYAFGTGSTGNFQEVDQCPPGSTRTGGPATSQNCNNYTKTVMGESAPSKKIDYIFMKKSYFKQFGVDAITTFTWSDHALIAAYMTECNDNTC